MSSSDITCEELLAVVSHDLRGPLNAITVALDGLRDPTAGEAAHAKYLAAIQRSVDKADKLLRDLVMAQDADKGALRAEKGTIQVRPLLDELAASHETAAQQARSRVVVEVADGVETVVADRALLANALSQLLANAFRHARGSPTVELSARPGTSAGAVVFGVRDHGPGIPAEALPHVFERGWPGRHRRAAVGMAIVRGVARAHGGDAHASAAPGGGTVVLLELPPPPPR